jgi:dipeptidyl aminopeptidase/acylaminoacyl peptidase
MFRFLCLLVTIAATLKLTSVSLGAGPMPWNPPQVPYRFPIDLDQPHGLTVYDLVRFLRLSDLRGSPNGRWVVFTAETWNPETDQTSRTLWLLDVETNQLRALTAGQGVNDRSPTWAPDSRTVAFVSKRSGTNQIWLISIDPGAEPTQLTQFPVDVDHLAWSPSGEHLAFSAKVYPEASSLEESAEWEKQRQKSPVQARLYERLFVRHWDEWADGKYAHLFALPMVQQGDRWVAAGASVDLMKGVDGHCPNPPLGGVDDFDWAPDGRELAYTVHLGPDRAWSTDLNIYTVEPDGSERRCLTASNRAADYHPRYSPDGRYLAYLAMARPGFESDRARVCLYDRQTGAVRVLTEEWDRSPAALVWAPDSKALYVTVDDEARRRVYRLAIEQPQPQRLLSEHHNSNVQVLRAGDTSHQLVLLQDSFRSPAEVYTFDPSSGELRRRTGFNDGFLKNIVFGQVEEMWFAGAEERQVQAWILRPSDFQPGRKYPLLLIIHGGPQGVIADHFHYRWNLQVYSGAGYGVLAINFHGSTSFGQAFTDSISKDWGGKPFVDLMKGLDEAIRRYDWIDPDRVAAAGASYGGWMINWIAGHSDRFRCLVNHAGPFDEFYGYFSTDELWFPEWEHGGVPWEKPELFHRFSPSRYVAHWKTPMLVIHGARDYRVPETDGLATFTALQRKGIPSAFLYFPDEGHWITKRLNSIVWHETVLAWLKRHLE